MIRALSALAIGLSIALAPGAAIAQEAKKAATKPAAAATPKAGPGEKVCRYTFPSGEKRAWVCDKAVPCCAWDEIKYVKCGTTITGCL